MGASAPLGSRRYATGLPLVGQLLPSLSGGLGRPPSASLGQQPATKPQNMKNDHAHHERIAKMTFASVYPLYLTKVQKKGRTQEELDQVISWLTGFDTRP